MPEPLAIVTSLAWPFAIAVAWLAGEFGQRWSGLPRISFYGLAGFILGALNCVLAVFAFNALVGLWIVRTSQDVGDALLSSLVRLAVSALAGAVFGLAVPALLRLLGTVRQDATVAFALATILLVAIADTLRLSPVVTTLAFGLATRHRRVAFNHAQRNFGALGELLTVLLFVFAAATLDWRRVLAGAGTIELRACDTPLEVERAAALAAYLQALCRHLLLRHDPPPLEDDYLVYNYNRFQASRFGLDGVITHPQTYAQIPLRDDIAATLDLLETHAHALGSLNALLHLASATGDGSDAHFLREQYRRQGSCEGMVDAAIRRFRGERRGF